MPICEPRGYKNTANGWFAVLAFRLIRMLDRAKVRYLVETAKQFSINLLADAKIQKYS